MLTSVDKEISIMAGLDHPSLIKLYEVIHDIENPDEDRLCLVIDYAEFGEIMQWDPKKLRFRPFDKKKIVFQELDLKRFFRDIVLGVDYYFSRGVVHRDLKPQNILVNSDMRAQIADFGCGEVFLNGDDTLTATAGTYTFLSPECCDPEC